MIMAGILAIGSDKPKRFASKSTLATRILAVNIDGI